MNLSGQMKSRPHTSLGPPKGSVLVSENGTPYFREIQVGEILFHLASYIWHIIYTVYLGMLPLPAKHLFSNDMFFFAHYFTTQIHVGEIWFHLASYIYMAYSIKKYNIYIYYIYIVQGPLLVISRVVTPSKWPYKWVNGVITLLLGDPFGQMDPWCLRDNFLRPIFCRLGISPL